MSLSPAQTGKLPLRRVLWGTEYFTLAFGSIVGVGWMVVLEDWYRRGGPVGAMLGFLLGGIALGPVAYVYGQLAERMPESGSEVAYTARLDSALPIRMDAEEHDEYGWFTFAEAYERIKWSDDREALEQLETRLLSC